MANSGVWQIVKKSNFHGPNMIVIILFFDKKCIRFSHKIATGQDISLNEKVPFESLPEKRHNT